jgi:Tol biopolymer transport system component
VDGTATHPFWSTDGRRVYYTPTGPNPLVRSAVRARPVAASGPAGEPFAVYSSADMLMPAYLNGTAPLATPDQIVLVLGDFRGDIWVRHLDHHDRTAASNGA